VVGVPEITPPLLTVSPVGKAPPEVIAHVYGEAPPVAASDAEYAVFTLPSGSAVVVIANSEAAIMMLMLGELT